MKTLFLYTFSLLAALCFGVCDVMAQTGRVPQVGDRITTESGIYEVSGINLISNAGFDDGLSGWKAGDGSDLSEDNFEIVADGGPDGSPCLHALRGAGSGSNQSVKTGWEVEVGKTYLFSCWAYRTSSGMSSNTQYSRLYAADSQNGTNQELRTINYAADQWVQTEYVFMAERPYLVANFGWLNAATSFDGFFLGELTLTDDLATVTLEEAIERANNWLASTTEGNDKGQYTTTNRDILGAAIAAAAAVLTSATTQDEINDAVKTLNAAIVAYEASKNPPFLTGVGYVITNVASGLNLSTADGTVRINTADPSDPKQEFYFEPAPDGSEATGYNLRDKEGNYVSRSGSWDTKTVSSGDRTLSNAIFSIEDMGDYVQIRCRANSRVLGVDNTADGSAVYSDKSGTDTRYRWTLMRNTPTAALEAAIATARDLAATTPVGNEYYQVPASALDALKAAIAAAEGVLQTTNSREEADAATADLNAAIELFKNSYNPLTPFVEGETYIVRHYGGMLLTTTTSGNASITAYDEEEGAAAEQLMTFIPVGGYDNTYYLQSTAESTFLGRFETWNTRWYDRSDTTATLISVEVLDGQYLGLKFVATGTYLGTDASAAGELTYSDKAGAGRTLSYWTIEPYITVVLERDAWNQALAEANETLGNAKEGYGQGEYFEDDIAAFRTTIATLRSAANRSKSQEELDGVTAQLVQSITDFEGKAHAETLIDKRQLTLSVAAAQTTLGAAVAGDLDGQYPQAAIDAYQTSLTAALAILDADEATQPQVDEADANLAAAAAAFAAQRVKIDYTALNAAIADAEKTLSAAAGFVGEGAGFYPQAAYDQLQTAVAAARAMVRANNVNQATVGQTTADLVAETATFAASRQANDTSALQALVDEATQLLADADAGAFVYFQEYYDDLRASLDKNGAMLQSTNQNEINRAVKLLRRDIDIFKTGMELAVGIYGLQAAATLQFDVYDMQGRKVAANGTRLPKGFYVVRLNEGGAATTRKLYVK